MIKPPRVLTVMSLAALSNSATDEIYIGGDRVGQWSMTHRSLVDLGSGGCKRRDRHLTSKSSGESLGANGGFDGMRKYTI